MLNLKEKKPEEEDNHPTCIDKNFIIYKPNQCII